jgi:hypothetical protein
MQQLPSSVMASRLPPKDKIVSSFAKRHADSRFQIPDMDRALDFAGRNYGS